MQEESKEDTKRVLDPGSERALNEKEGAHEKHDNKSHAEKHKDEKPEKKKPDQETKEAGEPSAKKEDGSNQPLERTRSLTDKKKWKVSHIGMFIIYSKI